MQKRDHQSLRLVTEIAAVLALSGFLMGCGLVLAAGAGAGAGYVVADQTNDHDHDDGAARSEAEE